MVNMFRALMARMTLLVADESGMSTVEYSIVSLYTYTQSAIARRYRLGEQIVEVSAWPPRRV